MGLKIMIAFEFSTSRKNQGPRVPDGVRIYAIGDIHGRADLLDQLLERVDADLATNPVAHSIEVFLGDYIDRGPSSRQVLDRLVARNRTHHTVFLKGNHETFLANFVANPAVLYDWQHLGGLETLMSYGITPSINADAITQLQLAAAFDRVLPESHRQLLGNMKSSYTCGDFFFVHAGVRPGIPLKSSVKKICFGFAGNSLIVKTISVNLLFMVTRLCRSQTFARIASTSIPAPMRPGN